LKINNINEENNNLSEDYISVVNNEIEKDNFNEEINSNEINILIKNCYKIINNKIYNLNKNTILKEKIKTIIIFRKISNIIFLSII